MRKRTQYPCKLKAEWSKLKHKYVSTYIIFYESCNGASKLCLKAPTKPPHALTPVTYLVCVLVYYMVFFSHKQYAYYKKLYRFVQ